MLKIPSDFRGTAKKTMTMKIGKTGRVVTEEEGRKAKLVFWRRLAYSRETVWKMITDPVELSTWYMTTAKIEAREGGMIDFVIGPSRFHVTGRVLVWKSPNIFEHEWKVAPRPELPLGEDAVVRWELEKDGETGTLLQLGHRRLNRDTAFGFAPGTHAFLDRLEARLKGVALPNWQERYEQVADQYPQSTFPRQ